MGLTRTSIDKLRGKANQSAEILYKEDAKEAIESTLEQNYNVISFLKSSYFTRRAKIWIFSVQSLARPTVQIQISATLRVPCLL